MSAANIVVYTAFTAGYDTLQPVNELWRRKARFVAFTEGEAALGWEARPLTASDPDPTRRAKRYKTLSHVWFPEATHSVWIDGSIRVISQVDVESWLSATLGVCDIAVFRHRRRACTFAEGITCAAGRKDDPSLIWAQLRAYWRDGYPTRAGLSECSVLVRRHTPAIAGFNEAWQHEIDTYSRRDQLSFDYVRAQLGVQAAVIDGTLARNDHFIRIPHAT